MSLTVVSRENARLALFEETALIRARIVQDEEDDRLRKLLDEGNELLRERELVREGVTDWSEL